MAKTERRWQLVESIRDYVAGISNGPFKGLVSNRSTILFPYGRSYSLSATPFEIALDSQIEGYDAYTKIKVFSASNVEEMIALEEVNNGDFCIRVDELLSYVAKEDDPSSLDDWQQVGVIQGALSGYYDVNSIDGFITTINSTINNLEVRINDIEGDNNFISLLDTPSSYVDNANKFPRVNNGEDALIFDNISGSDVYYENNNQPSISSVEDALNYLLREPPTISTFTGGQTVEKGSTVTTVTLAWTLDGDTPIYSSLTDVPGFDINVEGSSYEFSGLSLTSNKTYTLTVGDDIENPSDSDVEYIRFYNRVIYGVLSATSANASDLSAMNYTLDNNRLRSFTLDGEGKYIYIAHPVAYGVGEIWVGGLKTTSWVQTTVHYPNAGGAGEDYYVFRSQTIQNGEDINIEVK